MSFAKFQDCYFFQTLMILCFKPEKTLEIINGKVKTKTKTSKIVGTKTTRMIQQWAKITKKVQFPQELKSMIFEIFLTELLRRGLYSVEMRKNSKNFDFACL